MEKITQNIIHLGCGLILTCYGDKEWMYKLDILNLNSNPLYPLHVCTYGCCVYVHGQVCSNLLEGPSFLGLNNSAHRF